jgi:hypothetical protein
LVGLKCEVGILEHDLSSEPLPQFDCFNVLNLVRARRGGFPSLASQVPTGDVRFAKSNLSPPINGLLAQGQAVIDGRRPPAAQDQELRGIPLRAQLRGTSPPQVSGPKRNERFAIRGAKTQKSWLRPATICLKALQLGKGVRFSYFFKRNPYFLYVP